LLVLAGSHPAAYGAAQDATSWMTGIGGMVYLAGAVVTLSYVAPVRERFERR